MKVRFKAIVAISFVLALSFCCFIGMEGSEAQTETGVVEDQNTNGLKWTYVYEDGLLRITKVSGVIPENLQIPSKLKINDEELDVVCIDGFIGGNNNLNNVVSITIPSSVEEIKNGAFASGGGLASLKEVYFEDGSKLKTIGDKAFDGSGVVCSGYTQFVKLNKKETSVEFNMARTGSPDVSLLLQGTNIGKHIVRDLKINSEDVAEDHYGDFINKEEKINNSKKVITWGDLSGVTSISFHLFLQGAIGTSDYYIVINVGDDLSDNRDRGFSIVLPDSVERIGDNCFSKLAYLEISENSKLREIGDYSLQSVVGSLFLPKGLEIIGTSALPSGADITLSSENTYFALSSNGTLITSDGTELIRYVGSVSDYEFPESVTKVRTHAFKDNGVIKTITIPAGLEWEMFPFEGASSIESIVFDPELTDIPNYLFGKSGITAITIPSTVRTIGEKTFYDTGLMSVSFEDGSRITEIGNYAFCRNLNLTKVVFGTHEDGYSCTIGKGSFFFCDKLDTVVIPQGCVITQIGDAAFAKESEYGAFDENLDKVVNIVREDGQTGILLPKEVEYIGKAAFSGIPSSGYGVQGGEPGMYTLREGFVFGSFLDARGAIISFEKNSNVYTIDLGAFTGLQGVTFVDLSNCNKLNEIGPHAFRNILRGPLSITMPDDSVLTKIGMSSFEQGDIGYDLADIVIPSSVIEIGDKAFTKAVNNITFSGDSELRRIGRQSVQSIDLSSCTELEYVKVGSQTIVPAGCYEMEGVLNNIANNVDDVDDNDVISSNDSGDLVIGAGIIAINSSVIHGLDSITVENNSIFSAVDDILTIGGKLIAVGNKVSEVRIDGDTGVSEISGYALKDSNVSKVIIEKAGISIGDHALDAAKVQSVLMSHPDQTVFSHDSFKGNSSEISFFIPVDASDTTKKILNSIGTVYEGFGDGMKVYIPTKMGAASVFVKDVNISLGVASIKLSVDGGYTVYDLDFETDVDSNIEISQGYVQFPINGDVALSISPKDRTVGDMAKVIFDGQGGQCAGQKAVQITVPIGMTILDSEIPTFVKSKSEYNGVWLSSKDNSQYDFDSQVLGNITLVPDWKSRGIVVTLDVDCGDVVMDGRIIKQLDYAEDASYILTLKPYPGYEPLEWCYVANNTLVMSPATEGLVISDLDDDIAVTVTYTYYSHSSGLIANTYRGMPTDILSTVKMWEVGGSLDTSASAWRGHSSVPLIVDNYLFVRVWDKLYKVESDTGYVVKSVGSYDTNAFYHYLGYGRGMIIDHFTDSVYDTDLELLFTLDRKMIGYEYYDGYFWSLGTTLYRFPADASQAVDGVMHLEKVADFDKPVYTSYGFSTSLFIDGYIYRVYADGPERGIAAMKIEGDRSSGFGDTSHVELPTLSRYYLDDGWLSSYNGTIYLGGYTNGLFGAIAKDDDDRLAYVKANGLEFGEVKDYKFTDRRGFISQLVVSNGVGFINASAKLFAFKMNEDGSLGDLLGSKNFVLSHGSITLDSSYATEQNGYKTYVYMLPYDQTFISLGIMECYMGDDGYVMNSTNTGHIVRNYCSQAVRAGFDGQMIWYNDSGHVFGYTSPEKNPYYFFLDDGSNAGWYLANGSDMYEAAKSLGSDILTIDSSAEVSKLFGRTVSDVIVSAVHPKKTDDKYQWAEYEWTKVDSFNNRGFDTDHYFIITAGDVTISAGDEFTYVKGDDTAVYRFRENVGDRGIVGVKMAAGTDVSVIRFYQGDEEIDGTAIIGATGSRISDDFPRVYKDGFIPTWHIGSDDGIVVSSIIGGSFPEGGASYYLVWNEIEFTVTATCNNSGNLLEVTASVTSDSDEEIKLFIRAEFAGNMFLRQSQTLTTSALKPVGFTAEFVGAGEPVRILVEAERNGIPVGYYAEELPSE